MSDDELIDGYTQGRISRRIFVRRLVAGGLSLAAAVAYGNALAPEAAGAAQVHPEHREHRKHRTHHEHHRRD